MSQLLLTKEQRYLAGSEPALQPVLRKGYLLNNFVMGEYIFQRVGRRGKKKKKEIQCDMDEAGCNVCLAREELQNERI